MKIKIMSLDADGPFTLGAIVVFCLCFASYPLPPTPITVVHLS